VYFLEFTHRYKTPTY